MDFTNLIFYMDQRSLRESIEEIHFSTSLRLKMFFPANRHEINHLADTPNFSGLLYYFSENPDEDELRYLRRLTAIYPELKAAVFSRDRIALDAWKINAFHFEAWPVTSAQIIGTFKKYLLGLSRGKCDLTIKTTEGLFKIPTKDILYLQAAGNYTLICTGNDKCTVVTRQLGTFTDILEVDGNLSRVHRSLIVNFANINSCTNKSIQFFNSKKPLEISASLEKKIQKKLIVNG